MKNAILFLLALLTTISAQAGVVAPSTDCKASIVGGAFRLDPLPTNRVITSVLERFTVEPGRSSSESFILSGRVVSNNTGMPIEGVAISVRASRQVPRLAAITDTDGSFRFTVYIDATPQTDEDNSEQMYIRMRLPSITEGDLCLGGAFGTNRLMVSGTVSRYNLGDLKAAAKKPASEK
jgi:hypothetical protein